MRLFSWASFFVVIAGMATADCAKFLKRLNDPARESRICAAEKTMPFMVRGRWINKRFVAFAGAERFEGDDKVQRVGIVDGNGRPFATASAAAEGARWFDKSSRCKVSNVSPQPGGVTTLRLTCPVDN